MLRILGAFVGSHKPSPFATCHSEFSEVVYDHSMRFIYSLVILLVAHPALAEVSPQYYENARAQCRNESCCVASVDAMKKAGGVLPGANQSCFESWRLNTLKCASSLSWCEPNKELAAQLSTTPMTAADYEKAKTECAGTSCCLRSVESIYRGRHFVAGPGGLCPAGYRGEMLRCHDSLRWCEALKVRE